MDGERKLQPCTVAINSRRL